jgi:hypothetical protein
MRPALGNPTGVLEMVTAWVALSDGGATGTLGGCDAGTLTAVV